jgi:drug/metabolite transporter (DMT)-like permease
LLDRRLPRPSWFMGAAIAIAGEIALIGLRSGGASNATVGGDVIVLIGCIFFALGVVAGARLSSRINPLSATLWAITIGSAGLVPLAIVHWQTTAIDYHAFTATTWAAVFHITVGATIIANLLWLWALSRGGLVRVAPLQFSQPVCALFFAAALLGERLNLTLILVAAVIVFGTVTACRGARTGANKELASVNRRRGKSKLPAAVPVGISQVLVAGAIILPAPARFARSASRSGRG